ncbi:cysteine desulfurase family protein [uncultured Finegoldia sp.]|uniref:cysteine desulfurase family protein n=1 Tax=uncultured Finegoldia sp. TaxID=328009 RepID=UPI002624260B|nr:cysteine desulfurase family protein [uncultured Finegoldia sp.]
MIYLDNAATTKVSQKAVEEMVKAMTVDYGNPSSLYDFGMRAEKLVSDSRKSIANLLGVKPNNLFFTSCGTEGNNIAINGSVTNDKKEEFITTNIEHSSVFKTYNKLKDDRIVHFVDVGDDFKVDDIVDLVNEKTRLVSVMQVNNETGRILQINELGKKIKQKNPNTLFHVDGIQGFGKIRIDIDDSKIDFYSISGHKIHAPKGVGAIFIRNPEKVKPLFTGGSQEFGISPGTENVAGIVALKCASEEVFSKIDETYDKLLKMKTDLMDKLSKIDGVYFNSKIEGYSPYITNVCFNYIKSEVLLHYLEQDGIYISTGSACNGSKKSRIIQSINTPDEFSDGCIRISFTDDTPYDVIDVFVEKLKLRLEDIRDIMRR